MTSEEIKRKIQNNFSRHIAKALSSLDIAQANSDVKSAIKSEFWNACDDILEILELSKESKEEQNNGNTEK